MSEFPSVEEFKQILRRGSLDKIVKEYVFDGIPYVFQNRPEGLKTLRRYLSDSLRIKNENAIIIGSAKIGFSLSPDTMFRQFSNESDIDVLVVDERLFDAIWETILKWHYPRRITGLAGMDIQWNRRRRWDLYWGWLVPDRIRYEGLSFPEVLKPVRNISTAWFNTFKGISRLADFSGRDVHGRLYRSWANATLYHIDGLRQLRDILAKQTGTNI
jgi:hypothetical protein